MAADKFVDSSLLDSNLTAVANAIRSRAGTSETLTFPNGMVTAIENIPGGETTPMIAPYAYARLYSVKSVDSGAPGVLDNAFYSCTALSSVNLPYASYIGAYAFAYCSKLSFLTIPSVTCIGPSAFYSCSNLLSFGGSLLKYIGQSCFASCYKLTSLEFPALSIIDKYAFGSCTSLSYFSAENLDIIEYSAFNYCSSLAYIYAPNVTSISGGAFAGCWSLSSVSFSKLKKIDYSVFYRCSVLNYASFKSAAYLYSDAFRSCWRLVSLYLGSTSLCILGSSYAFSSTPIAGFSSYVGRYGYIYVPTNLYSKYKSATNWSYFSYRFISMEFD